MSYEFTKLSEVPAVSEFPQGANAIIETNGEIKRCPSSGGGSVPKPLTYDYMPAGYPTKTMGTVTLMEEQALAFASDGEGLYGAPLTNTLEIFEGQTYTVKWDGTEYECVCVVIGSIHALGNKSIIGAGADTGEPFFYGYSSNMGGGFNTLDTSASHTISVKKTGEIFTPMAEEFIPAAAIITYDSSTKTYSSDLTNGELRKRLLSGKQIIFHRVSSNEYFYLTKWKKESSGIIYLYFAGGGSSEGTAVTLRTDGTIGGVS